MEYIKGKPFFCDVKEKIKEYHYLCSDIFCDILIIGGGIDGSIANYFLSNKYDTCLVDKSRFGHGCTPCATALLEYQLDDFASELKKTLSQQEIIDVYKMGLNSIEEIEKIINKLGNHCEFSKRPTFMYSNSFFSARKIEKEYAFRKEHGLNCILYNQLNNPFYFKIKNGLYCPDGGCELNPYLFTKQLIENSINQKKMFENTDIDKIIKTEKGYIAETCFGDKIHCNKIIISTGFNWELINKHNLCERFISYTIVTNPLPEFQWFNNSLIQDCLDPYHYLRMLPDNRIIYGGEDTLFHEKPIDDRKAKKKYNQLFGDLIKLFPQIAKEAQIDYSFCGCFGSTENNLGLIGETEEDNIFYLFSCGANGIINAIFGAKLIDDIINKIPNTLEKIFSPQRIIR